MGLTPVNSRFLPHPSEEMFELVEKLTRLPDSVYVEIGPREPDVLDGDKVLTIEPHVIRELASVWLREHQIG